MKRIINIFVIIFVIANLSYASEDKIKFLQSSKQFDFNLRNYQTSKRTIDKLIKDHQKDDPIDNNSYYLALYGKANSIFNDIQEHKIISTIYSPFPNIIGPGLRVGYIKTQKTNYDESIFYIQPSINLPVNFIAFRLGMNIIHILEGEGPDGLLLPSFEIKFGNLKRFYISGGVLSELFFGWATVDLNYRFNDGISSVMIGRAYGDDGKYTGYTYKIDYNIWKKFMLRLWGNENFTKKLYGTQIG